MEHFNKESYEMLIQVQKSRGNFAIEILFYF